MAKENSTSVEKTHFLYNGIILFYKNVCYIIQIDELLCKVHIMYILLVHSTNIPSLKSINANLTILNTFKIRYLYLTLSDSKTVRHMSQRTSEYNKRAFSTTPVEQLWLEQWCSCFIDLDLELYLTCSHIKTDIQTDKQKLIYDKLEFSTAKNRRLS